MSNWGKAHINNTNGFGQASRADNGFGSVYDKSESGDTVLNPLNVFADATVAFSLRDLGLGATHVVRVRRDSDNQEQDFTATEITDGSLLSFVGSGDGLVSIWYDQKGNFNRTQTNASNQPELVEDGVLTLDPQTGKPALKGIRLDSLDTISFITSQPNTKFIVGHSTTDISNNIWSSSLDSNARNQITYRISNGGELELNAGIVFNPSNASTENLFNKTWLCYALFNGGQSELSVNGGNINVGDAGSDQNDGSTTGGTTAGFIGYLSEEIFFNSNQSENVGAIKQNINNHYAIY